MFSFLLFSVSRVQCGGKSVAGLRQIKIALASEERQISVAVAEERQISVAVAEEKQIAQKEAKVLKVRRESARGSTTE
jgi:hypothetical protein